MDEGSSVNDETVATATDGTDVYQAQIQPLVAQIYALCRAHGIPFIQVFQLSSGLGDPDDLLAISHTYSVYPDSDVLLHALVETLNAEYETHGIPDQPQYQM